MPLSPFEVGMQTMACVVSEYLQEKKNVPVITKDGLNQLMEEQFPHCEKEEISPGAYRIRIPMAFSPTVEGNTFSRVEWNIIIVTKKCAQGKCDDAASQDFMDFPDDLPGDLDLKMLLRLVSYILNTDPSLNLLESATQTTADVADQRKAERANPPVAPKEELQKLVNE
ncbi:UNVERIFIED_CONTAM: hypothetical protein K2H54_021479 [Gekko kuhli]